VNNQSPESAIIQNLERGETLLWSGKPLGGVRLRAQDILLIPFSLMWGGFAIFWEYSVITHPSKNAGEPELFFTLWGIPFVCIGLYFIFGRFFVDAYNRSRTFYGVTNERIIILSGIFSRQFKSLQLRNLSDISLNQRNGDLGTITFGPSPSMTGIFVPAGSWPFSDRYTPPSFDLIERPKAVYEIIRQAQKRASRVQSP
jgi:Bacterial PH domain